MPLDLLQDLRTENNFAFGALYEQYFSMVHTFVVRNSGQPADAEDVFQDTMVVLVEKLRRDDFQLTATLKTYVYAIAKLVWLKKLRSKDRYMVLDDWDTETLFIEVQLQIEEESTFKDRLTGYMSKISLHCQNLINDMFFREKTIEQIQDEYGYSSRHNAQNQKHKCVEQIRKVKKKQEHSHCLNHHLS